MYRTLWMHRLWKRSYPGRIPLRQYNTIQVHVSTVKIPQDLVGRYPMPEGHKNVPLLEGAPPGEMYFDPLTPYWSPSMAATQRFPAGLAAHPDFRDRASRVWRPQGSSSHPPSTPTPTAAPVTAAPFTTNVGATGGDGIGSAVVEATPMDTDAPGLGEELHHPQAQESLPQREPPGRRRTPPPADNREPRGRRRTSPPADTREPPGRRRTPPPADNREPRGRRRTSPPADTREPRGRRRTSPPADTQESSARKSGADPRKRPSNSPMGGSQPQKAQKRCPFQGCQVRIHSRLKWHIYHHMPTCFQFREKAEEAISGDMALQQVGCLRYLAQKLTGTEKLDPLLLLLDEEAPDQFTWEIPTHLQREMRALISTMKWSHPGEFRIRPSNTPAVLLHWRALSWLTGKLTQRQWERFYFLGQSEEARGTPVPEGGSGSWYRPHTPIPSDPAEDPCEHRIGTRLCTR